MYLLLNMAIFGIYMSHEKYWLGYIGDYTTQLYIEIIINHEIRIPELTNQDSMESRRVFFVAHMLNFLRCKYSS